MDDLAILINDKITRRGIAKGLVFIQEDLNNNTNNAYNANFNNGTSTTTMWTTTTMFALPRVSL